MKIHLLKQFLKLYLYRLNHGSHASDYGLRHKFQPATDYPEYPSGAESAPLKKKKIYINILLFIATLCTTTFAGAHSGENNLELILSGLPYSLTLLSILGIHEFGHYFAAKKFKVDATLPYFIPFPSIVGTMGAVIKTRTPIPDTRALFYIGIMGPLPGFAASIAAAVAGIYLSEIHPIPVLDNIPIPIFGDSILFKFLVNQIHGNIPEGQDIFLHPFAWAGWIGFLVTSLNLIPIGQLDGGHILYSLIGRKQVYAGWGAFIGLIMLSFLWPGWIVWIILSLFLLMIAHPAIPRGAELNCYEKTAGWFCMIILLLTFIPVPVEFL